MATGRNELVVRAEFGEATVFDDGDAIGSHSGRQAMGDDNRRPPLQNDVKCLLDH
jgi:hypothetical protein